MIDIISRIFMTDDEIGIKCTPTEIKTSKFLADEV